MVEPLKLYQFREEQGWAGSQPIVGIADKEVVRSTLLSAEEMSERFGGYVEYDDVARTARFVGVWSDRTVAQFLRYLREQTEVEVIETTSDKFRQHHRASR